MQITVALTSTRAETDVENIINLKQRLEENIELEAINQREKPISPDDAGAGVLKSILDIVIGKEFFENLLDVLKEWIKSRPAMVEAKKSKMEIELKNPDGKEVKINIENLKDVEKLKELFDSISL